MGSPRLLVVAALCGAQRIPELPSLPVPNEPFAVLEHVNLNSGRAWDRRVDAFYFDVLRCARDSRASSYDAGALAKEKAASPFSRVQF